MVIDDVSLVCFFHPTRVHFLLAHSLLTLYNYLSFLITILITAPSCRFFISLSIFYLLVCVYVGGLVYHKGRLV